MLGLPSTTEVNARIPKEAFYAKLKMNASLRASFTHDIERMLIRNSLKSTTLGIPAGEYVCEVMVLEAVLRRREVPAAVLAAIAQANAHKFIFACTFGDETRLAVMLKKLMCGAWTQKPVLELPPGTVSLDHVWDTLASQVVFGDTGRMCADACGMRVEERAAAAAKLSALREELVRIDMRARKEKQFARKNELFDKARALKAQIAALEKN